MSGAEILTVGKATIWFAIPLGLALLELQRTRRSLRRDQDTNDEQQR